MYRYTAEDRAIISEARKQNKDKRAEKRLHALELRAEGKSAKEVATATGFHSAYISQLSAKYEKTQLLRTMHDLTKVSRCACASILGT